MNTISNILFLVLQDCNKWLVQLFFVVIHFKISRYCSVFTYKCTYKPSSFVTYYGTINVKRIILTKLCGIDYRSSLPMKAHKVVHFSQYSNQILKALGMSHDPVFFTATTALNICCCKYYSSNMNIGFWRFFLLKIEENRSKPCFCLKPQLK